MGLLLELLLGVVLELVLGLLGTVVFGMIDAIVVGTAAGLLDAWDRERRRRHPLVLAAIWMVAAACGAVGGAVSLRLVPWRLAQATAGAVAAWVLVPTACGWLLRAVERRRSRARRTPASAFLAGALFGLAWLAARRHLIAADW